LRCFTCRGKNQLNLLPLSLLSTTGVLPRTQKLCGTCKVVPIARASRRQLLTPGSLAPALAAGQPAKIPRPKLLQKEKAGKNQNSPQKPSQEVLGARRSRSRAVLDKQNSCSTMVQHGEGSTQRHAL